MKKLKNTKAFTLVELIVTIAISGIFCTMVGMILASNLNLFGGAKQESNNYNNVNVTETLINTFIDNVNKEGLEITIDPSGNLLTAGKDANKMTLAISNERIEAHIGDSWSNSIKLDKIVIMFERVENTSNIKFVFKSKDKVLRNKIYNIIGGIA